MSTKTNSKDDRRRRGLIVAAIAVVLMLIAVFATLAYLTSQTKTVDNVMTAGKVEATLDEYVVDDMGVIDKSKDRTQEGNDYTLMPNHQYVKDPTIHVQPNSQPSWVYAVVNDMLATPKCQPEAEDTPEQQMVKKGWVRMEGVNLPAGLVGHVYYWPIVTDKADYIQDIPVFDEFKIKKDISQEELDTLTNAKINVTGLLIQEDGFKDDPVGAYNAVYGPTSEDPEPRAQEHQVTFEWNAAGPDPVPNYTSTIKVNDGETLDPAKIEAIEAAMTRSGYQFMGWSTNQDCSGSLYHASDTEMSGTPITADVQWFACWHKIPTITFSPSSPLPTIEVGADPVYVEVKSNSTAAFDEPVYEGENLEVALDQTGDVKYLSIKGLAATEEAQTITLKQQADPDHGFYEVTVPFVVTKVEKPKYPVTLSYEHATETTPIKDFDGWGLQSKGIESATYIKKFDDPDQAKNYNFDENIKAKLQLNENYRWDKTSEGKDNSWTKAWDEASGSVTANIVPKEVSKDITIDPAGDIERPTNGGHAELQVTAGNEFEGITPEFSAEIPAEYDNDLEIDIPKTNELRTVTLNLKVKTTATVGNVVPVTVTAAGPDYKMAQTTFNVTIIDFVTEYKPEETKKVEDVAKKTTKAIEDTPGTVFFEDFKTDITKAVGDAKDAAVEEIAKEDTDNVEKVEAAEKTYANAIEKAEKDAADAIAQTAQAKQDATDALVEAETAVQEFIAGTSEEDNYAFKADNEAAKAALDAMTYEKDIANTTYSDNSTEPTKGLKQVSENAENVIDGVKTNIEAASEAAKAIRDNGVVTINNEIETGEDAIDDLDNLSEDAIKAFKARFNKDSKLYSDYTEYSADKKGTIWTAESADAVTKAAEVDYQAAINEIIAEAAKAGTEWGIDWTPSADKTYVKTDEEVGVVNVTPAPAYKSTEERRLPAGVDIDWSLTETSETTKDISGITPEWTTLGPKLTVSKDQPGGDYNLKITAKYPTVEDLAVEKTVSYEFTLRIDQNFTAVVDPDGGFPIGGYPLGKWGLKDGKFTKHCLTKYTDVDTFYATEIEPDWTAYDATAEKNVWQVSRNHYVLDTPPCSTSIDGYTGTTELIWKPDLKTVEFNSNPAGTAEWSLFENDTRKVQDGWTWEVTGPSSSGLYTVTFSDLDGHPSKYATVKAVQGHVIDSVLPATGTVGQDQTEGKNVITANTSWDKVNVALNSAPEGTTDGHWENSEHETVTVAEDVEYGSTVTTSGNTVTFTDHNNIPTTYTAVVTTDDYECAITAPGTISDTQKTVTATFTEMPKLNLTTEGDDGAKWYYDDADLGASATIHVPTGTTITEASAETAGITNGALPFVDVLVKAATGASNTIPSKTYTVTYPGATDTHTLKTQGAIDNYKVTVTGIESPVKSANVNINAKYEPNTTTVSLKNKVDDSESTSSNLYWLDNGSTTSKVTTITFVNGSVSISGKKLSYTDESGISKYVTAATSDSNHNVFTSISGPTNGVYYANYDAYVKWRTETASGSVDLNYGGGQATYTEGYQKKGTAWSLTKISGENGYKFYSKSTTKEVDFQILPRSADDKLYADSWTISSTSGTLNSDTTITVKAVRPDITVHFQESSRARWTPTTYTVKKGDKLVWEKTGSAGAYYYNVYVNRGTDPISKTNKQTGSLSMKFQGSPWSSGVEQTVVEECYVLGD